MRPTTLNQKQVHGSLVSSTVSLQFSASGSKEAEAQNNTAYARLPT